MAFIKRINYLGSFTTLFVLTGLSLACLIIFILYVKFSDFKYELDFEKSHHEYNLKKEKIDEFYENYSNIVLTLQHNKFFKTYLTAPTKNKKENLLTLFETIVQQEKYINQLRYIDQDGNEIVRVDRTNLGNDVVTIKENKLQNKKHRDYFKNTIKNKPSEISISRIDLNIENRKVEIPYKPVLRFSVPIFDKLSPKGVLIINIFGNKLLKDLVASNSFEIDIFDQDNHLLISNDTTMEHWSRYLKKQMVLEKSRYIFSDVLIKNKDIETLYIGFKPKSWVNDFFKLMDISIIFLIIFIIAIGFLLAYMLSRIPKKLFDELDSQQNMLIQQSKVAAMGEMTSMLAHQWRQPLNSVSVLLQEIEIKRSMNLLDDKEFGNLSSKINNSITHMSKTIDDFRDFFKVKKKKNRFNIEEVINSVYSILEVKFKKDDISFSLKVSEKLDRSLLEVESFEGEFKQVIINILNNSIDALEDSTKENKQITIKIFQYEERLCISIEDNGGGIKESIKDKLFEPYSSTKLEKNGTGLGLYMSKMLLEKDLKGYIEAENINDGARFSIYI